MQKGNFQREERGVSNEIPSTVHPALANMDFREFLSERFAKVHILAGIRGMRGAANQVSHPKLGISHL